MQDSTNVTPTGSTTDVTQEMRTLLSPTTSSSWHSCSCLEHAKQCWHPRLTERHIVVSDEWSQTIGTTYPPNNVKNTKYNPISFIPKVLYEQFRYFFNMYFLVVALSQMWPLLQVGFAFTYYAPLAFVLSVTMVKELHDDIQRWKMDKAANSQKYQRVTQMGTEEVASSDMRVGDIIIIPTNMRVPADCVLLQTSEKNGACFIRTDQLDGETDWKLRHAVPVCQKLQSNSEIPALKASIFAEAPHKEIYNFIGTFTVGAERDSESLDLENTLWCNTVVATGVCTAAVIYTGPHTRSAMNASQPPTKMGILDQDLNFLSKVLFVFCITLAGTLVAMSKMQGQWYITWFRFILLFSSIIPISLRVNLDMGKAVYSYMIMKDKRVVGMKVNNSSLPEELGRISFLFSDKTGTLTRNEMYFRKLFLSPSLKFTHEGGLTDLQDSLRKWSEAQMEAKPATELMHPLDDPAVRPRTDQLIAEAICCISLCHNVTPVLVEDGIEYQASSPDEVALVKFTESVGLTLVERDVGQMVIRGPTGNTDTFTILNIFPFTSQTKRMGIVVRNMRTNLITFYMKGADVVMQVMVVVDGDERPMRITHHSVLITDHLSPTTRITHHPPLITYHSSLITHHSSLITRQSSFITHHSSRITPSFITHHSSLITHHSSLITHHSCSDVQE
eukprot:NODE_147_length_2353_cov_55.510851_g103_i0.p1 GENE.NODE_147_length_2353_cov_55.510851_g103_i0~~NODE_147_length_2353_cov_55.510851_g103_i0.p1  ORF type:complete len:673 (-),score=116.55 NODE_147_length_2353_cov_55.510851_g103_i0:264-2282(-)